MLFEHVVWVRGDIARIGPRMDVALIYQIVVVPIMSAAIVLHQLLSEFRQFFCRRRRLSHCSSFLEDPRMSFLSSSETSR